MAGKKVSQSQCASTFGVHRNTLANWLKQGCPYDQKANKPQGKDWVLDTADVAQWREDQAIKNTIGDMSQVTEDELKRRKLAAETTILEIEAAKKRGEVAPLEDMETAWRDAVLEFKARIRLLPSRCANQLTGLSDETEIKAVLLDEVDQTLTVLSEYSDDDED
jgi:phage terminase Nu1 subunit (DNA packaging protein)